jgi:hypothetical protein
MRSLTLPGLALAAGLVPVATYAARAQLELEAAAVDITSNVVQRPNDANGDRFDVTPLAGRSTTAGRLTLVHPVAWGRDGAELRLTIAPLQQVGTGAARAPIRYGGDAFEARPLTVLYQFNTYRVTCDVPVFRGLADWEFRAGATLAIRDAQIRLAQGPRRRSLVNYGPVPLAYGAATWHARSRWSVRVEGDAFPAPGGGGLFDASARIEYALRPALRAFAGARYVAGGADDPEIYNALHGRAAILGVRVSW